MIFELDKCSIETYTNFDIILFKMTNITFQNVFLTVIDIKHLVVRHKVIIDLYALKKIDEFKKTLLNNSL